LVQRAFWKGYLKMSLVTCRVARTPDRRAERQAPHYLAPADKMGEEAFAVIAQQQLDPAPGVTSPEVQIIQLVSHIRVSGLKWRFH
jgi:hypothetical protein